MPFITDIEIVVTTDGSRPTRENSTTLNGGDSRGSCVWFNQASMFQSAELGFSTVQEARDAGVSVTSDSNDLIDEGLFPTTK
jgi:hypothetical protein